MVLPIDQRGAEVSATVGSEGRQNPSANAERAAARVDNATRTLFTLSNVQESRAKSTEKQRAISFVAGELQQGAATAITGSASQLANGLTEAGVDTGDLSPAQQDVLRQAQELPSEIDRMLGAGKRDVVADIYYKRKVAQLIARAPGLADNIRHLSATFKPEADIIKSAQREQLDQYAREKGLQDAAFEHVKTTAGLLNIDIAGKTFDQLRTDPLLQSYMNSAQRTTAALAAAQEITARTGLSTAQKLERTNQALEGTVGDQLLLVVTATQQAAAQAEKEKDPVKRATIVHQAKEKMQAMILKSVGTLDIPALQAGAAPFLARLDAIESLDDEQLAALNTDNSSRQAALQAGLAHDFPEAERATAYIKQLGPLAADANFQAVLRKDGVMATLLNPLRRDSGLVPYSASLFGQGESADSAFKNGAASAKQAIRMFASDSKATPAQQSVQAAGVGELMTKGLARPKYDGFVAMLPELSNPALRSRLSTPAFRKALSENQDQLSKFYTDLITKVQRNLRTYEGREPRFDVDAGGNIMVTVYSAGSRNGPSDFYQRQVVREPTLATLNQFVGLYINAEGGDKAERSKQVAASLNGAK